MTYHQRKLTDEDLKKIEEHNGDIYCMFTEAQICGYGVYDPKVIQKDDGKYLIWSMGSSCD